MCHEPIEVTLLNSQSGVSLHQQGPGIWMRPSQRLRSKRKLVGLQPLKVDLFKKRREQWVGQRTRV